MLITTSMALPEIAITAEEVLVANVKHGNITPPPQWWKHLRDWKRIFWKRERMAQQRNIANDTDVLVREEEFEWKLIRPQDDVYTIDEFLEHVDDRLFVDSDGFGELAIEDHKSNIVVYPSRARKILAKYNHLGITHIVWYNR